MSKKMTDENSKLAAKRTLCVILTVLVGYILLGIPYVKPLAYYGAHIT